MTELTPLQWTFVSECQIPDDVRDILVSGEEPIAAYKTIRDTAIFTSKRLMVRLDKRLVLYQKTECPKRKVQRERLIIAKCTLIARKKNGVASRRQTL